MGNKRGWGKGRGVGGEEGRKEGEESRTWFTSIGFG